MIDMKIKKGLVLGVLVFLLAGVTLAEKDFTGSPMFMNVNSIRWDLKKLNGEGQFTNQYSWMLTGSGPEHTELFYWPRDQWHSQMLYQVFNPIMFTNDGFTNEKGEFKIIPHKCVNGGVNDYSHETRRYRPPYVTVDDMPLYQEYRWDVDPELKTDIHCQWEDVLPSYGMRVKGEMMGFSNPDHEDYVIVKMTYYFTGETKRPIEDPLPEEFFPDQTVTMYSALSYSFGPSKCGEYGALGTFSFEGEDDLDSWFEKESELVGQGRTNLKIAYYWDQKGRGVAAYPNGSTDDSGDPDRITGHLLSPQIPGFTLLHAPVSPFDNSDDIDQPFSMPHAGIVNDLWGRSDGGIRDTYLGLDERGRFPKDIITEGWAAKPEKGPMRFITVGPYELTKNSEENRFDSVTFAYAVGAGSISYEKAREVGKSWFEGEISDEEKDSIILTGKDSLFNTLDKALWAWGQGLDIDDPPPPPDVTVKSDADRNVVTWSYPSSSYFLDPDTKQDDWAAWRVYRKKGSAYVNDPWDNSTGTRWELVHETNDREETRYVDQDVRRGSGYYYAVTAMDNGTSNKSGVVPGKPLESSRYVNCSTMPAIPFKAGLAESDEVRVVPNPATIKAGALGYLGDRNRLVFARLPYECLLKVFTETGDHVTTIHHKGTDQEVWDQKTNNNQYITAGCYILSVLEAKDVNGNSLSDQFVKFVVIR